MTLITLAAIPFMIMSGKLAEDLRADTKEKRERRQASRQWEVLVATRALTEGRRRLVELRESHADEAAIAAAEA
jgi:hypothetical protein